ncbi:unnamed protein product [Psylliodes chrysocephalus]|uniref:Uncharacterized protein n=1 Tax=Psylliodes chrysocephalus TaxID=3402493 RepID=A0A9P0CME2_9CUCU|nr:unnamed protein product [Psylliodes chrysocephala]
MGFCLQAFVALALVQASCGQHDYPPPHHPHYVPPPHPPHPEPYPQPCHSPPHPEPHVVPHPHPYPHPHPVPHVEPHPHPYPPHPEPYPQHCPAPPHPEPHVEPHPHPYPLPHPEPYPQPCPPPHPPSHPPPHPYPHPPPHPPPYVPQHPHPVPPPPPPPVYHGIFPHHFSFGVSSGAYDHEGAWLQDGAGESIYDRWVHNNPHLIIDGSNGDVSADSYNHLEEDVEILNNLTVRHYVFSLSWPRIIPNGCGEVNKAAIKHYQRQIKLLRENQIEPIVVLYNGDLPQALEDQGGFLSDQFPKWFTEYANVAFECFGGSVQYWITFQDPFAQCYEGYGEGTLPPGIGDNPGVNEYICGHNLLKAHADVYHLYDDSYRHIQKGKLSMAIFSSWFEPATDCQSDIEAAETRLQFHIGWFAHPIYVGDYPKVMIQRISQLSELQGLCESRLPVFTRKEIEWIKDTHDFFALNYIFVYHVNAVNDEGCLSPSFTSDAGSELVKFEGDDTWGVRKIAVWVKKQYLNPSIFILNNGFISRDRTLEDYSRIDYIKNILIHIYDAITKDDVRIYAYTYYSYIDGFMRAVGHTIKFGLYDVEFDCPARPRTARISADYYRHVCKYGCIDDPCPPRHHHEYFGEHVVY